ncbi:MAG: diphosphomevalonate decarboxylase [Microgenomates group bacterium]
MKKTAWAPSNIAFIKYWGKKDEALRLPENGSISMNLSNLFTITTVEFDKTFLTDEVTIDDEIDEKERKRVIEHLNRIRKLAKINYKAKVVSKNSFPKGTGLSSSASGFAALTLAATAACGLKLSEKELSILARQGSGSACRSIPDGFVEWLVGETSEDSYAYSLFPPNYWDIVDVVVIVSSSRKEISSTEGQKLVPTSPFYSSRLLNINKKMKTLKKILQKKNFSAFGELIEQEALELHAIMLTSKPSLIYLTPSTIAIIKLVKKLREEGLSVYFTLNTGCDIHLIIEKKNLEKLLLKLKYKKEIKKIIVNYPSKGAKIISKHLF